MKIERSKNRGRAGTSHLIFTSVLVAWGAAIVICAWFFFRHAIMSSLSSSSWQSERQKPTGEFSSKKSNSAECQRFDHSILKPNHGCEVNKDTLTVFCNFNHLRIDNTKIELAHGGEALKTVMGRAEEAELPEYQKGAFTVPTKPIYNVPMEYRQGLHYIEKVLNKLRYPHAKNLGKVDTTTCHKTYPGTTLFITRYEYVNWYHTLTDLWNAYFVLPGSDVQKASYFNGPHRVIFLDGHAQGGLDEVWQTLFGDFQYIQHLPKGGVCFDRAIFIPAGYKSPLYTDIVRQRCPDPSMAAAFSSFVLNRFRINPQKIRPQRGRVLLIDRQHYISHPRSDPNNSHQASRQISNLEQVKVALQKGVPGSHVDLVRLETLHTFADQLRVMRQAHIVVAMHGAALSHLMFMNSYNDIGEDGIRPAVVELTTDYMEFFEVSV